MFFYLLLLIAFAPFAVAIEVPEYCEAAINAVVALFSGIMTFFENAWLNFSFAATKPVEYDGEEMIRTPDNINLLSSPSAFQNTPSPTVDPLARPYSPCNYTPAIVWVFGGLAVTICIFLITAIHSNRQAAKHNRMLANVFEPKAESCRRVCWAPKADKNYGAKVELTDKLPRSSASNSKP
ncbi:hypothetical protein IWW54_003172 [Coemansia sp. RSA 2705]|nr:hypothetical protein IWW54_003172 [Coemansia sp. RSA 2705]